jgi:cytochrome b
MTAQTVRVWDPLVRIFHWALVAAFATAWLVEDHNMTLHAAAGYTVIVLVLVRIVWGFVGPPHARFSDFVRGPREVIGYLRAMAGGHPPRTLGHNPAGGAMIVALLVSLLATTATGLISWGIEGDGLLGNLLWRWDVPTEQAFEEVHEFFANFTLMLVVLHLAGVAAGSLLHRENLVRSMVTGRKNID